MTPVYVIGLLLSILFCGLGVDTARMQLLRTQMQNAADAAAIAAELESEQVSPGVAGPYDWVAEGKNDAALNGFTDGQNGATITVTQKPTVGDYAGRYDAIQVTITQTFKATFLGLINHGTYTLTVNGVALVPPCAYFLASPTAYITSGVYTASASVISNCPLYSNAPATPDGFAKMWGFGVNVSASSGTGPGWTSQWMEEGWGGVPPQQAPTFNAPVMTDPLLSYIPTEPTFNGTCYKTNYTVNASATLDPPPVGQAYCGTYNSSTKVCTPGLKITTNGTVMMNPGLYVFTCGLTINGTANDSAHKATLTGSGVTLYFTNPTQGATVGFGQVLFGPTAQAAINLSAPLTSTNGSIPGILFFTDRNWVTAQTNGYDQDVIFNTYTSFTGDGIWYLPNTGLYMWLGNWTEPNYGGIVATDAYMFGGQFQVAQNFAWLSGGSPFRTQQVLVQ